MASMDNGWIMLRESAKQNTNNETYLQNLYSDIYHEFCHIDLQYNYPVLHQIFCCNVHWNYRTSTSRKNS